MIIFDNTYNAKTVLYIVITTFFNSNQSASRYQVSVIFGNICIKEYNYNHYVICISIVTSGNPEVEIGPLII